MVLIPQENRAFITMTNANNWIPGPGLSSTELIPKGVMLLLAGVTPEQGTSLGSMYLWIDVFCALILAALALSFRNRVRDPLNPGATWFQRARHVGPLRWEIGIPILLLVGFPQLYEVHSWTHVMTYTPDLAGVVLVAAFVWFATGVARAAKLGVAARSRRERTLQGRLHVRAAHSFSGK